MEKSLDNLVLDFIRPLWFVDKSFHSLIRSFFFRFRIQLKLLLDRIKPVNRHFVGRLTGQLTKSTRTNFDVELNFRSGSYEIETIPDDIERGTAIRCYLRDDCVDFSKEETIKRKNFVRFDLISNGCFFFVCRRNRQEIQ